MLVIYEPGAHSLQERVVEELQLVGVSSITRKEGRESDVRESERQGTFDAIVYVPRQKGTILFFPGEAEDDARKVRLERQKGESEHVLALRTAEHLHGELLETGSAEEPARPPRHHPSRPYSLMLTAGPALLIRSYASVGPGFVGDAAYFPLRRLGLGGFVSTSLMRQPWAPAPDQFEVSEFSGGAQVRGVLVQQEVPGFELQAFGRLGGRVLSLQGLTGNPDSRFTGNASGLIVGAGLEMNYAPLRWLALGTEVGGMLGLPLAWPRSTADLKKPEQRALTEQQDAGPDGTFLAAAHVSVRF